ncbi:hypothetical protein PQR62_09995 [Herbaspirillum lusitanum]|uniref:O-antigen/teichoic acid export membrane protein n=1 Tax=Herbaspirillum lusitanum TaxID=213312 RepID=A0ABW9A9G0_9BURK
MLRGAIIAQGIAFAALPVMSRLYSPDAFGTLQSMLSIVTLLLVGSSLRFEIAILSAKRHQLRHIVKACLVLCFVTGALSLVIVTALWFAFPALVLKFGAYVFLIPLTLLLSGLGQVVNNVCLRLKTLSKIANGKIGQSGAYVAVSIGAGAVLPSTLSLVVADACGRAALLIFSVKSEVARFLRALPAMGRRTLAVCRIHRHLPLLSMPSALINVLGSSFTSVMLLAVFHAGEAGNYALIDRALGAPITMLATAQSQAFMSFLANNDADGAPRVKLMEIARFNALVGLVPMIICLFAGPKLVVWILGQDWEVAGRFVQVLAPLYYITFITTPFNMTLVIMGKQGWQLLWDIARLAALALMWLFIIKMKLGSMSAVILFGVISSLLYLIHITLSYVLLSPVAKGRG